MEEEVKALDLHRLFHVFTSIEEIQGGADNTSPKDPTNPPPPPTKTLTETILSIPSRCSTGIANYRRTWSGGFRGDSWEDDETYYGKQATATKREIFDENGTVFGPAVKNVKFIKRFIESGGDLAKSLPPSPPPSSVDSESIDFQKHAEAISSELKDVDLPTVRRRATAFALETMKVAKASVVEFVGGYKEGRESEYEKARTIYFRALDEDYAQEKGTGNNMWKDDDNLGRNIELIRGKLKNVVEEINEATATKDKSSSTNTDKKIDEIGENFERNVEFLKDKANELMRENKNVDVHENVEKNLQFLKNQFDEAVKNIDAMKKK